MEGISHIEGVQDHILSALKSMDAVKMGQVSTTWKPLSRARVKQILETRMLKAFCEDWEAYLVLRRFLLDDEVDISVRRLVVSEPHRATILDFKQKLDKRQKLEELEFNTLREKRKIAGLDDIPMWEQHVHQRREQRFIKSQQLVKSRLRLEWQRDKICSLLKFCLPQKNHKLVDQFHKSIHTKAIFKHLLIIQNSL